MCKYNVGDKVLARPGRTEDGRPKLIPWPVGRGGKIRYLSGVIPNDRETGKTWIPVKVNEYLLQIYRDGDLDLKERGQESGVRGQQEAEDKGKDDGAQAPSPEKKPKLESVKGGKKENK